MTGHCNICGWSGIFLKPERQREGMLCGNCSASSRHRLIVEVLGRIVRQAGRPLFRWPAKKQLRILESSARGSYPIMLADKFDYYATEYDPSKIEEGKRPRAYADFQKLHYADGMFDVVVASDVFEHVRKDEEGYREIFRVLKDGGSFILTVPYDHNQQTTIPRVDTSGDQDVNILEPEYHGGGGHTLTYRNYGRDLLSVLHKVGYSVGYFEVEIAASGITKQSVIVCRKGDFVEIAETSGDELGATKREAVGFLAPYRMFLLVKYNLKGFLYFWRLKR